MILERCCHAAERVAIRVRLGDDFALQRGSLWHYVSVMEVAPATGWLE